MGHPKRKKTLHGTSDDLTDIFAQYRRPRTVRVRRKRRPPPSPEERAAVPLTAAQAAVFACVPVGDSVRAAAIRRKLGISKSAMTSAIMGLSGKGYVERGDGGWRRTSGV